MDAYHGHITAIDNLHILLALIIMGSYIAIPFTALRKLAMLTISRVFAIGFFATCAITHLAVAAEFHDNQAMIINDFVQAVCALGFIITMNHQIKEVLKGKAGHPETEAEH